MKKLILLVISLTTFLSVSTFGQVNFNNQAIVYFQTGVQRVPPSNTTANVTSANVLNVLNTYGIPTSNVVPTFPEFNEADTSNPEIGESSRQMNRAKVFTITAPSSIVVMGLINDLNNLSEVLYAEANGDVATNIIPADGRFGQQWGLLNPNGSGADIHAEPAWNIFTGNPNAIIAIIDNGVDRDHNDLNAKILGGDIGFLQVNGLFGPLSHGSHVAGIAAAITNNAGNNGVAGVDWQARIHPKNIFDGGDADINRSIIDAVNFNQNVWTLNNSWSMRNADGSPGRYSVTARSAFAFVYRNNRVSCAAMGNDQANFPDVVGFPSGFNSGIIAVGATDQVDGVTWFSSQGQHIDVSAPGNEILSTNFNNGYIEESGTSMSTAFVSGLASLLKGFNTNLANDDIEQIIRLTADDRGAPGFDNAFGTGRINALRALQALQAPNTVQHLNTTGGTIFSTSANATRIFLGFPGLVDAAYAVRRSEVRTNITFPPMCNIIGVWGRGVGTTGFREERGRCFGEGICEIVPGTLTSTGCTLRTWVYEVWTVAGQYVGFRPAAPNNVVFQYTILGVPALGPIQGASIICNSEDYRVINLPGGASVAWSIPGSAGPVLQLQPHVPNPNELRITNQKWYQVSTTLTATITNAGCTVSPIVLNKPISNDNSGSASAPYQYYQEACSFYNVSHPSQSGTVFSNSSPTFVHQGCMVYVNLGNINGLTISLASGSGQPLYWAVGPSSYYPNTLYFQLPLGSGGVPFVFNITGDGACYQRSLLFFSYSNNGRYTFNAIPNPVKDLLTITAKESEEYAKQNEALSQANTMQFTMKIYEVNTKMLQMVQRSSKGSLQHQINTSRLRRGYYILQITEGDQSQSIKFFKE